MSVPPIISELVNKFRENISEYKSQHYNETEVRREFIDPFFEALGWDVKNKEGKAEAYKDVKHEASVKIKGETRNPDYAFKVGTNIKFFVEAKRPAVNIADDISPAFQVRRYGWTAHLSLCVLTDFEEFAVYDTRVKPNINDAPSTARIMYFNFKDYETKWDEIASVFSKDAVYKGSFDRYADDNKKKKGTKEVDDDFLELMESWRESLARNIALRNKNCPQFNSSNAAKNLNEVVQKTIDRIVFLRICEDRGIEETDQLRNAAEKANIYGSLCDIFRLADAKYNSGLFHFQKETGREQDESWMLSLKIDNKVLKDIIKNLYYPAPYAFAVMPADILGHIYEKFLGKVIRLTAGLQAKVEEKPEVRKAGGVYYTPTYIVDYIVKNTVGELLKDKTPEEAESIRILDPACGSGSFLIGAYQYLLDWYLNAYSSDSKRYATGKNTKIIAGEGGEFRLTTAEKKKILLNNIYGVDIDSQAVEVTKLSLLLKVLEGESSESISAQFRYASERALPDLDANIKCGNSLIGTDYFDGKMGLDNSEEWERIKPFDWETEFPHVFAKKEAELKAYHVTWATHASRYSKKLGELSGKDSGINAPNMPSGIELSVSEREKIANYILEKIKKEKYRVSDLNVMNDHVHLIICCEKDALDKIIGEIKGYSSRMFNKNDRGVNPSVDKPMYADGTIQKLWARSFGNVLIADDKQFDNTSEYIKTNHIKHKIPPIRINRYNLMNKKQLFEPVFSSGGFDAVIGNPPYINFENMNSELINYSKQKYQTVKGYFDIYQLFLEKVFSKIKNKGSIAFIIPNLFLKGMNYESSREYLLKNSTIKIIRNYGDGVFNKVKMPTCIIIYSKEINNNNLIKFYNKVNNKFELNEIIQEALINNHYVYKLGSINDRIKDNYNELKKYVIVTRGLEIGKDKIINSSNKEQEIIFGKDISRYLIKSVSKISSKTYEKYKKNEDVFRNEKVIIRETGNEITCVYDNSGLITNRSLYCIRSERLNLKLLLGILNSKLIQYYYCNEFKAETKTFPKIRIGQVNEIPIPDIKTTDSRHDTMVSLVETMLELNKKANREEITATERKMLEQQIAYTDKQIDKLVYQLYELTEEEIKIVEGEGK